MHRTFVNRQRRASRAAGHRNCIAHADAAKRHKCCQYRTSFAHGNLLLLLFAVVALPEVELLQCVLVLP
jgi:hypothetical protein